MVADGLTKGSVDRSALSAIMDGTYELHHAVHEYKEPASNATTASSSQLCTSSGGGAYGASAVVSLEGGEWFDYFLACCAWTF